MRPSISGRACPAAALALLALLASCQSSVAPTTAPSAAPAQAAAYAHWVQSLTAPEMQGRGAGTAGIYRARDLLTAEFARIGLVGPVPPVPPTADLEDQAANARLVQPYPPPALSAYTQPFRITLEANIRRQSLHLSSGASAAELLPQRDFAPAAVSGNGAFQGAVVFVGYGIRDAIHQYDSYAQAGGVLAGKVALAFAGEPMDRGGHSLWSVTPDSGRVAWTAAADPLAKARWAQEQGAVALLLVDPPAWRDLGPLEMAAQPSRLVAGDPRVADLPVMRISGDLLQQLLHRAGRDPVAAEQAYQQRSDRGRQLPDELDGVTLTGQVLVDRPEALLDNVLALLPGQGPLAQQLVVVGAHYDHLGHGEVGSKAPHGQRQQVHPGADDNASGVAALLLLARGLRERWPGEGPAARRSVLFVAFAAEERGLLGSHHLLEHLRELGFAPEQVAAMVNLDMVGRLRGRRLQVIGGDSSPDWAQLLVHAARGSNVSVELRDTNPRASDQVTFLLRDIPAVLFFTGLHRDYHRPSDTAEKINVPGALAVTQVAQNLVAQLATQPQRPVFRLSEQVLFLRTMPHP